MTGRTPNTSATSRPDPQVAVQGVHRRGGSFEPGVKRGSAPSTTNRQIPVKLSGHQCVIDPPTGVTQIHPSRAYRTSNSWCLNGGYSRKGGVEGYSELH